MLHKGIEVLKFNNQSDFVDWLRINHKDKTPYWLKLVKKNSQKTGITYKEAREAALMHGWIDGGANRMDDDYWLVRFTHRRPKSVWSKVNVGIIDELINAEKMHPEGLKEVKQAKEDGRWGTAY